MQVFEWASAWQELQAEMLVPAISSRKHGDGMRRWMKVLRCLTLTATDVPLHLALYTLP